MEKGGNFICFWSECMVVFVRSKFDSDLKETKGEQIENLTSYPTFILLPLKTYKLP